MEITAGGVLSPYELVLEEIRKGKVNPFDVDLDYLITLFQEQARDLENSEYLREAGRFLEASAKLMKLKVEVFFPEPERRPRERKVTVEEVKEVLGESQDTPFDLSWLYEYTPRVGRPKGAKDSEPRTLTWREFWSLAREEVPLHREVNYSELAKEIRKRIKRGEFRIRSIRDFIAYLFAYYEFEDVPEIAVLHLKQ